MTFPHYNKKVLLLVVLLLILWICTFIEHISIFFYDKHSIKCYRYEGDTLSDISTVDVRKGNSIFFHETSCNSYLSGKIVVTARQACAVESAALRNPNSNVYLLFTSPGVFKFENTVSDKFIKSLLSYGNINIHHLNFERYIKDTPLEELYKSGQLEASQYSMSHASDVLRYLTLWKYGGIYMDLDLIVIKSFEDLPPNFSGCESYEDVAAGVIGFGWNGTGHRFAENCVMDLKVNFSGTLWGNNGPGVITRLVYKICNVSDIKYVVGAVCDTFNVLPPESFYAIPWRRWKEFFEPQYLSKVISATEKSYVIHVWNKHSYKMELALDSNSAYNFFARTHCPKVYAQCEDYF